MFHLPDLQNTCRMRIRDLYSKIRDLFSKTRLRDQKTAGALEPPEPLVWRL